MGWNHQQDKESMKKIRKGAQFLDLHYQGHLS